MPRLLRTTLNVIRGTVAVAAIAGIPIAAVAATPSGKAKPAAPAPPAVEAAPEPEGDLVRAAVLTDAATVAPGGTFTLGVKLTIKPHWHVYWQNPGETGDATRLALTGPAGFTFGPVQWPLPTRFDTEAGVSYGYENEVMLLVPVTVAKDAKPGPASVAVHATWLSCKESCIEGEAKLTHAVTIGGETEPKPANREQFDAWRAKLPVARDAAAAAALAGVDQADGAAALTVRWTAAPKKVEWFPVSTPAVSIEDVKVAHAGQATQIQYKVKIYKANEVPAGGRMDSVLVFEDAAGKRHGVVVPFAVAAKAP